MDNKIATVKTTVENSVEVKIAFDCRECDPQTRYECGGMGCEYCELCVGFVNLTPHDITIIDEDGNAWVIPKSGVVARCETTTVVVGRRGGIPITKTVFGDVVDMPAKRSGVYFIVSRIVAEALRNHRFDVYVPNESVRDESGAIIGCRSLAMV